MTARTSAPARRAPARRSAPPLRKPATRKPAAAAKRRRTGHTPIAGFVPVAAAAGAVGGIADSGLFVWLTRGRLWIGLLGGLLVGIVGLNVMALSFSASSSNAGQAADALRRQNSALRAQIAGRLSNSEIQGVAADLGLVMPSAGGINYLDASPGDPKRAAERLRSGELSFGAAAAPVETTTVVATLPVEEAPVEAVPVETAPVTTDPAVSAPPAVETVAPPVAETASTAGAVGAP